MAHDIEHLRREIDALEKQISSHPFEGLFDRKRMDQLQDKLKKKRKELARLVAGGDEHEDIEPRPEHIDIPEFSGIEETPDLGPDFPMSLETEEEPLRKPGSGRPAAPIRGAAKSVSKAIKKVAAKATSKAKPKAKPKPVTKKKTAAKPAKKKPKR